MTACGVPLYALACPGATTCYAAGMGGTIVGTTDGGQSWHPQRSGIHVDLYALACPDPQSCYAMGAGSTILTTR
ncbi:MAG TPA: hypothetical protein VIJ28_21760 [Chloroflexota bacterium]